jgi:M6 family metalloprotease-like protein
MTSSTKQTGILLLVLLLLAGSGGVAGEAARLCGSSYIPASASPKESPNGIYIPARGTLRILIVFASFPDDETPHPCWPAHAAPLHMRQFIDPDTLTHSTGQYNLTRYFREMSMGRLNVIGEPIWIESLHSQQEYLNGSFGRANWSILQESVDPVVDFSQYDHWTRTANYEFSNAPDGLVDMIIMVWRTTLWQMYGEASLGHKPGFTVDSTRIEMGFPEYLPMPLGSGVTCEYPYGDTPERVMQTMVHEVGHWLLGGSHPYNSGTNFGKHAYWGLMCNGDRISSCANTYERERLGWITVPEILEGRSWNLTDYLTSGSALKYHLPGGEPNEYYYIENHQFLSTLDDITRNTTDKGAWILHQQGPYVELDNLKIVPSDGTWDWENPSTTNSCFGVQLPVFHRGAPDLPYGLSHRDQIPTATSAVNWMLVLKNDEGAQQCGVYFAGEGLSGAFSEVSNPTFSPYSNPVLRTWSGQGIPAAFAFSDDSGGIVTVRLGNIADAAPARRYLGQNPVAGDSLPGSLPLAWGTQWTNGQLLESNVVSSEMERRVGAEGAWERVYAGSGTSWRDHGLEYDSSGSIPVRFRVRVVDAQGRMSAWSNLCFARAVRATAVDGTDAGQPHQFSLVGNYPNPFNPSTIISYSIHRRSTVRLTIFNVMGEEVRTLEEGTKDRGEYRVRFDAAGLASGVYFCRLRAEEKSATIKMLLLR